MIYLRSIFLSVLLVASVLALPVAAQTNILAVDPLIVAVYENQVENVRALVVRKHPMSRAGGDGRTAMMWGSIQGSYDSLVLILEAGAQINIVDEAGNNSLYHAAENGHIEVVELLLTHNAEIDRENRDGRTPLMAAARAGHQGVLATLIAAGAEVGLSDFTGRTALDLAREGRSRKVVQMLEKAKRR